MLLMLSLTLAAAEDELPRAHFHPDKVAAFSELFRMYSERLGPRFDQIQAELTRLSSSLEEMERAVLLLGEDCPEPIRERLALLRRELTGQYKQIQAHISLLEEDSGAIFGEVMSRALEDLSQRYQLEECAAPSSVMGIAGPGGRSRRCEGSNLDAELGRALDADEELKLAVEEILSIPWPELSLDVEPIPAVDLTGSVDQHLDWTQLAPLLDGHRLEVMADTLSEKLYPYEEAIAGGDEEAYAEAQEIRARYNLAMGERGRQILEILPKGLKKAPPLGLCLQPAELGGCVGEDLTETWGVQLLESSKVQRALSR